MQSYIRMNRIKAVFFMILMVGILFCSYSYMIENVHHDCSGEECPVCMELRTVMQIVSQVKLLSVLPVALAVLCVFTLICIGMRAVLCANKTLILLKVELLN